MRFKLVVDIRRESETVADDDNKYEHWRPEYNVQSTKDNKRFMATPGTPNNLLELTEKEIDLCTTQSSSPATKTAPKSPPSHPDRLFSGQSFNSSVLLFFTVHLDRESHSRTVHSLRWGHGFWLFRRNREGTCYSVGCSELQEHSG